MDFELDLKAGDLVLLYTDGVTEARDEAGLLGVDRLAALLEMLSALPPAELTSRLVRAVNAFERSQSDDIALVALRVMRERRQTPR